MMAKQSKLKKAIEAIKGNIKLIEEKLIIEEKVLEMLERIDQKKIVNSK